MEQGNPLGKLGQIGSGVVDALLGQKPQPKAPEQQLVDALRSEMGGHFEKLMCEVRDIKQRMQQRPMVKVNEAFFPELTFDADGYKFNAVVCSDGASGTKLTVTVQGVSYQVTLSAGINQTNFPDGAVVVAPDNTHTYVLIRSNYQFKTV